MYLDLFLAVLRPDVPPLDKLHTQAYSPLVKCQSCDELCLSCRRQTVQKVLCGYSAVQNHLLFISIASMGYASDLKQWALGMLSTVYIYG